MAAVHNIVIDQGSDFSIVVTVRDNAGLPLDLAGHTVRGQLREHYKSNVAVDFTAGVLNSPPSDGKIIISLTAAQTEDMDSGRWVYDIEIVSGGIVTRVLQGTATVTPEVTRM